MEDLTTSGRMFISGPWINTEMTVYLLREVDDETGDIQLRSRSNHQTDCGFGNYEVKWHDIERRVSVEVEPLHPIYRRHLDEHDWAGGIPREQWIGFKQITRTVDRTGHVTVEGYVNYGIDLEAQNTTTGWRKLTEFTFTGENVTFVDGGDYEAERQACIGQGDEVADDLSASTRWTAPGQWCWIRINGVSHARFKFFSVREIDPL
jgi:hypothetical protein